MRQLHRAPRRSWFAASALLTSLLFGPLGFGPGHAASIGSADCARACPCDEHAEPEAEHHEHEESGCPEEGSEEPCPPGCDECSCCPGAAAAVASGLPTPPEPPADGRALRAPPEDPARGVPERILRPPRATLI